MSDYYARYQLVIEAQGEEKKIRLTQDTFTIGREDSADYQIPNANISRRHLQISIRSDGVYARDLNSVNGTYLGERRLMPDEEVKVPFGATLYLTEQKIKLSFALVEEHQIPQPPASSQVELASPKNSHRELEAAQGQLHETLKSHAEMEERNRKLAVAQRTADRNLAESKAELDQLKQSIKQTDALLERLKNEAKSAQMNFELESKKRQHEIEQLQTRLADEKAKVRSQSDLLKAELDAHLQRNKLRLESESHSLAQDIELEKKKHRAALDALQNQFNEEKAKNDRQIESLHAELDSKIHEQRLAIEAALKDQKQELATFQEEAEQKKNQLSEQIQTLKANLESEAISGKQALQFELKKQNAEIEAIQAEGKAIQCKLNLQIQELELKRLESEKQLKAVDERVAHANEALSKAEQLTRQAVESEQTARHRTEDLRAQAHHWSKEIEELKKQSDDLREHNGEAEAEILQNKKNAEIALRAHETQKKQEIEKIYDARTEQMNQELAQVRVDAERKVQQMEEAAKKSLRDGLRFKCDEIVDTAFQCLGVPKDETTASRLKDAVKGIMTGKSGPLQTMEARQRSIAFWKGAALWATAPLALVAFYFAFPDLPSQVRSSLGRSIASQKNDGGVFMEQIKQRSMQFQALQDRNYRKTYLENLLYLEGYAEMKTSDEVKKEWTQALNQFVMERLHLSDRMVIEFITIESSMTRDILSIRETATEQYRDFALSRMTEIERQESQRLVHLLKGPANYESFREFEKNFYLKHLQ